MRPRTNHHATPHHPDPEELARRIAADRICASLAVEIAEKDEAHSRQREDIMAAVRPLREENARAITERKRLLDIIRRNDTKIRTITSRADKRPNDLIKMKLALSKRKETIKERYLKLLIATARAELERSLPINPILVKPTSPITPIIPIPPIKPNAV